MPQAKQEPRLKIIPLGGLEEVGRNMTIFEYDRDIVIVDMGLQFPEEDMPGIDYVIPNISYLKGKENYIRGVIVTHGHFDHIGGIPHIMHKIGNPTIFTARLTQAIIEKRQEDYKEQGKLNIYTVDPDKDNLQLGSFKVEFFRVNHNIPDGFGVVIHSPVGSVMHTGDFKFDPSPVGEKPTDIEKIKKFGQRGIKLLMSDSTGSETEGDSISEQSIMETLDQIIQGNKNRIIIATFSSLLSRIQQIIMLAEKCGRKVVIQGYSMKSNVEIAVKLGYLKAQKGTLISPKEMKDLPKEKVIIACTGAQGEDRAVLMRIANKEHREIKLIKNDTVIFSSSVVPGNERTVQRLKDNLTRQGAELFHYKMMDVHTGGHALRDDLKRMIQMTNPKYFVPIHGNHYMLKIHGDLAADVGIPRENILLPDNGHIMEFTETTGAITKRKVPANHVMVDGLGIHDSSNVVIRDRQMLAKDGMFVVIATIDGKTGKLVGNPDLISRGFIYMKESKGLVEQARKKVRKIVESKKVDSSVNYAYLKNKIRDDVGQFLYSKTERRPMVLPVVIEV
ncbi:MAG: ribonuclease J [Parcubacteria group bacterium]|nr:ribonuclease J [Parcubacteria group bacterium]